MQNLIDASKQLPNEMIQEVLSHATIPKEIRLLLDAPIRTWIHTKRVNSVAFSSDGKFICTGGSDNNTAVLWSVDSDVPVRTWRRVDNNIIINMFNNDILSIAFRKAFCGLSKLNPCIKYEG